MEGFRTSLHVKGVTAKRLQQAVTDLLSSEGFRVLDADATQPESLDQGVTRGVWIAKAKGDWTTIFCSDFLFQQEIGRELSKQLKTHILNVWTNEGSSWHYSLFHLGEEIDQFDSTGDSDDLQQFLDSDMNELADEFGDEDDAGEAEDLEDASPVQEGLNKIAELQEQMSSAMPADVRAIYERLQEGQVSLGEMRKFDQWSQANQAELARFQEQIQAQTAELTAAMQGVFHDGFQPQDDGLSGLSGMLQGALPPDIAELFAKVLAGQATGEELQRFAELSEADEEEDEESLLSSDDDIEEAFFGEDTEEIEDEDESAEFDEDDESGDRPAISEAAVQQHLGALHPLLNKSVDPAQVAETLTSQDETPEQPLGEFLSFLGIDAGYSELDFDCLEDLSDEELSEQGIELHPLLLVRSE